jgi:hypothetical protein
MNGKNYQLVKKVKLLVAKMKYTTCCGEFNMIALILPFFSNNLKAVFLNPKLT